MEFTVTTNTRHSERSEIAERALIAAVLVAGIATFERIDGIVTSADFGNSELAAVFAVLEQMRLDNDPIDDIRFVVDALTRKGALESIGCYSGLAKIANEAMPHNAVFYACEIRSCSRIRRAWNAAVEILKECTTDAPDLAKVATVAADRLLGITSAVELMNRIGCRHEKA